MAWVVLLGLLFFAVALYCNFNDASWHLVESTLGRIAVVLAWTVVGSLLGVSAGAVTAVGAGALHQTYCDKPVNTQLYSMEGHAGAEGDFLFIDQEYTYHYFSKSGDAISENDIEGSEGQIYEDSSAASAHVATYSLEFEEPWTPFTIGGGGWVCLTQFHVPPGTVSRAIQANP